MLTMSCEFFKYCTFLDSENENVIYLGIQPDPTSSLAEEVVGGQD